MANSALVDHFKNHQAQYGLDNLKKQALDGGYSPEEVEEAGNLAKFYSEPMASISSPTAEKAESPLVDDEASLKKKRKIKMAAFVLLALLFAVLVIFAVIYSINIGSAVSLPALPKP